MSIMKKINKFFFMFFLVLFLNIFVGFDVFADDYSDLIININKSNDLKSFDWLDEVSNFYTSDTYAKKFQRLSSNQSRAVGEQIHDVLKSKKWLLFVNLFTDEQVKKITNKYEEAMVEIQNKNDSRLKIYISNLEDVKLKEETINDLFKEISYKNLRIEQRQDLFKKVETMKSSFYRERLKEIFIEKDKVSLNNSLNDYLTKKVVDTQIEEVRALQGLNEFDRTLFKQELKSMKIDQSIIDAINTKLDSADKKISKLELITENIRAAFSVNNKSELDKKKLSKLTSEDDVFDYIKMRNSIEKVEEEKNLKQLPWVKKLEEMHSNLNDNSNHEFLEKMKKITPKQIEDIKFSLEHKGYFELRDKLEDVVPMTDSRHIVAYESNSAKNSAGFVLKFSNDSAEVSSVDKPGIQKTRWADLLNSANKNEEPYAEPSVSDKAKNNETPTSSELSKHTNDIDADGVSVKNHWFGFQTKTTANTKIITKPQATVNWFKDNFEFQKVPGIGFQITKKSSDKAKDNKILTSPGPSQTINADDAKDLQNAEKGGRGMPCFMAGMMAVSIATRAASMATMNMSRKGALGNILKLLGSGRKTNNPPSLGEGSNPPGEGSNPPGEGSNPDGEGSNPDGEGSNPDGEGSNPHGEGSNPHGESKTTPLTIINNFNDMSVRRLDADAEEMPSEADLIPRLSPVARAFMKSNGGLEEVLQMLPASPQQLVEKLVKDGPKEYLTFLDPSMNDPVFEQLLSKVETLDKSASIGTLLSSRQGVSVESTPVELSIEPLSIASGWDSAAYLRRDIKNRDDIWHKNTEDNLFQIVSKRLRTVLR